MTDSLTIAEHKSAVWKIIISAALAITIIFIVLFLVLDNPLIVGIFRLIAFIGFASLIIALLQKQGEKQEIRIGLDDDNLYLKYYSDHQKTQEELFKTDTINQISIRQAPAIWKIIPRNDCTKLQITFTDTTNILSMLRYNDRDLYINHADAQKAILFFRDKLPAKAG